MRKRRPVTLTAAEDAFDLGAWVERELVVVAKSGPEWTCGCPVCGREKLAVHVRRKAWQCWHGTCRFRGWRPTALVSAVLGVDIEGASHVIGSWAAGVRLGPAPRLTAPKRRPLLAAPVAPQPPGAFWGLTPRLAAYARSRGVPEAHVAAYALGGAHGDRTGSKADKVLAGRLVLPAFLGATFAFWSARDTSGRSKAKYVNLPRPCRDESHPPDCTCYHREWGLEEVPSACTADDVLFGLHQCRAGTPMHLVEGPLDVAVCGPSFAAPGGAHLSARQAALIVSAQPSEVVLLFDPDEAGDRGRDHAAALLDGLVPLRVGALPAGYDPGKLGREATLSYAGAARRLDEVPPLGVASTPRPTRFERPPPSIVPPLGRKNRPV